MRLLRFKGKSEFDALDYTKMSVTLNKYGLSWNIFRGFTILFGLFVFVLGFFAMSPRTTILGVNFSGGGWDIALMFWFVGIFAIFIAFNFRYAFYQIDYTGSQDKSLQKMKFEKLRFGSSKLDSFIDVVRQKTNHP